MEMHVNSRLCLGTVQFGLEYGINNKTGKPNQEDVYAMLDFALEHGIEYFDTAAAYGNAEEVLGQYFRKRNLGKEIKVISKLRPNLLADDCPDAEAIVEREIRASLDRLGLEYLEGYLLHTPTNFYNQSIMRGLARAKEMGLIKNLGVSIYETQHALDVVSSGLVDYIQIPYNIFDQRLEKTDFFNIARNNEVMVFARAPFLQGLVFMYAKEIPEQLARARGYLDEFDQIITDHKLSRVEASLLFSAQNPGIDRVVFGVDNLAQLKEDIQVLENGPIDFACREELMHHFINMEKEIIFPSLWAKKE